MKKRQGFAALQSDRWMETELARCRFKDARHGKRLRKLLEQLSDNIGGSIPWACQDWANTKAAYRFLSNSRVSEHEILAGHFQATSDRLASSSTLILMLHDTTEFTFHRNEVRPIGILHKSCTQKDKRKRPTFYTVCGILMHSSLAVTRAGLPLGLAAVKFWTRDEFKGCNALKRRINPTRVPIEQKESYRWLQNVRQATRLFQNPERCVHIGDRESDIYELFCTAQKAGTHFLLRTCVDRLAGNGKHTVAGEMKEVRIQGLHRIQVRNKNGEMSEAVLEIRYRRIRVLPPIGKQKEYPELLLTVLHANERGTPKGREKINWKLITNLPVQSRAEAIEKLEWYAMRWKIETFHKILKSGCKAEESRLRSAERLVNLVAVLCILSWRVFWMTMVNRTAPKALPAMVFTSLELRLLDKLVKPSTHEDRQQTLTTYLTKLAQLGGYLARAHDPPPGNKVMWRGLCRLTDIELGAIIGAQLVC
jgi:Transposase DNA-binding